MKVQRVLHVSSARSWRGGEQQISYLVKYLADKGVENWVFCPEDSPLEKWSQLNNITTVSYNKGSSISFKVSRLLKRTAQEENIDLIHVHDSHAHNYAWFANSIFGNETPLIVSRRVDFKIPYSSIRKYNHKDIRKIICVSDYVREVVGMRVRDKSKLMTIYSGVQKVEKHPNYSLRKSYGIPDSHKLIGNVAALAEHKDYFTFVNTAEALIKSQPDTYSFLMIGGDGDSSKEIKTYIKKKGLQHHIIHTGFIPEVKSKLSDLDLLLFTSKEEGLGTSILDAFNAGVPVVATNTGGIPEIVRNQETGLLSEVKDHLSLFANVRHIFESPALTARLIENAKKLAEKLSEKNMAHNTLETYNKVLK